MNKKDELFVLGSTGGDSLPTNNHNRSILNPYINFHTHNETHRAMDLVSQQWIQSNGMSGYFLPKEFGDVDRLFGEELEVSFNKAWQFAFYMESYSNFGGMGSHFGYGGLTVDDEMKILINRNMFMEQCDGRLPEFGDWVYIKKDKSLFEVRYVDPYHKFYQLGDQTTFFVHLAKVTYNQEELQPEIQNDIEFNLFDHEEDDLSSLFNLEGRLDTHIKEFVNNDYIQERSEDIVLDREERTGTGTKIDKNRKKIDSIDDINNLLGGRKLP